MKVKALADFQDGNILAFTVKAGQVIEVTPRESELIAQSGGDFQPMPEDAELTPIVELSPVVNAPETREQMEARHTFERQQLEAKQLKETQQFDADEKVAKNRPETRDLHLTDNDGAPQATRAVEEEVRKKVAQKKAEEEQRLADKFAREAEAEVQPEPKPIKPIVVDKQPKK
jgi:signal recognition particle GTPase